MTELKGMDTDKAKKFMDDAQKIYDSNLQIYTGTSPNIQQPVKTVPGNQQAPTKTPADTGDTTQVSDTVQPDKKVRLTQEQKSRFDVMQKKIDAAPENTEEEKAAKAKAQKALNEAKTKMGV
ncbi:hypothetical protein HWQ67_05670 [Candidatus Magnetobacterium casensis]|uniref:Uncharacterized protein n=2 Tax=Candidatus Magnetobacterium casense TaxID=1455061 RepID=A0ABS6RWR5_9BACT|nr:hypothetical protein [Candidatus Magnetobacterium casensis]